MTNTLSSFISLCAVNKFSDNQCHFMNKTAARCLAGLQTEGNRSCEESVATPFP